MKKIFVFFLIGFFALLILVVGISLLRKPPRRAARPPLKRALHPPEKIRPRFHFRPQKRVHEKIPRPAAVLPKVSPRIAIIIDDFGTSDEAAKPFLSAPYPIALSILPDLPFSSQISREAKAAGKPVLLHLPVEALHNNQFLGPGALFVNMKAADMEKTFETDLASVPDAEGVNNHMGSKGTRDPRLTGVMVKEALDHHLFLIDSLTIPDSVLYEEARKIGVPAGRRDVFLDDIVQKDAISTQFDELIRTAQKDGKAIAIGHPHPETWKVLMKRLPELKKSRIQIVPVTELLEPTGK